MAAGVDVATTKEVLESASDEVDVTLPTSIAIGGGAKAELLDISSVLFIDEAIATVDITGGGVGLDVLGVSSVLFAGGAVGIVNITELEVVNAGDSSDVVEEPNSESQNELNEGVEVVIASVVLSGAATAVLMLLLPVVVEVPLGDVDKVSKTVSSTVTVLCSTVVEERGLAGGGDGGADEASSGLVDLDSYVLEEVVVFLKLDATSRGRRPASRIGGYFSAFAVGARMDAKASVAVHAGMELFIMKSVYYEKCEKVKESECGL